MPISEWPESERPREKLFTQGAAALSDGELIALFLGTGSGGRSALDIARNLLEHFGSTGGLMRADLDELLSLHGLGQAKVARLAAITELAQRSLFSLQLGVPLTSPRASRGATTPAEAR